MRAISRRSGFVMCAVLLAAAGCKSGDDDSAGGTGGTTGGSSGTKGGSGAGGTNGGSGGGAGSGATGAPTFSAIFQEIVVNKGCNGGPLCHAGTVGKLTMLKKDDTYAALVGVDAMGTNLPPAPGDCKDSGLKRVVAGDPDHSLLMLKVEGMQPCGMQMPPGANSMLSADQIAQIRMWIQNGAKND